MLSFNSRDIIFISIYFMATVMNVRPLHNSRPFFAVARTTPTVAKNIPPIVTVGNIVA